MVYIDEAPEHIINFITQQGYKVSDYIVACKGDLNLRGKFTDYWVLLTHERFFLVPDNLHNLTTYMLSEIDEFYSESLISTGLMSIRIEEDFIELCRFTNTLMRKFSLFVKIANKVIKNEDIKKDDIDFELVNNYCQKCGVYLPDNSMKVCYKCIDRKTIFMRLLSYSKQYRADIIKIIILIIINSLLALVGPYLSGKVFYDEVLADKGDIFGINLYGRVLLIVVVMIGFRIISMAVGTIYGRMIARVSADIVFDLKNNIFESMQNLSMRFFSNKQTGTLMTRVNSDTQDVLYFFIDGLPYFISNIINILGIIGFLIAVNPGLTIMSFWPVPLIFIFFKVFLPKFYKMHGMVFRRRSRMNARMHDSFSGIRVVKAFGKEEEEIDYFNKDSTAFGDASIRVDKTARTVFPLIGQTMWVTSMLIYIFGGILILNGKITFGIIMTYLGYMRLIYDPILNLANTVIWWANCMNSANRIFEIIDAVPEIKNSDNPIHIVRIKGDIEMKDVSFSYEVNKPVLHGISVSVKAGEMIGLVGHSGAGKSTITNLITRLYDVNEGEITIDGYPIKEIDLHDLRSQIGMVLQDTYLFMGTIAENIAYAKPEATMEEIIAVAKAANCHDFITKLPDGYDTIVGVGGHGLSGGEKQRISIARALLHDPRILILDEATSAVDTDTERQIQEALERLVKGRTTFAIAHRLSTLRNADRLMVIEKGRLVELGTHEEVYNMKGVYHRLYEKQKEALKLRGDEDIE